MGKPPWYHWLVFLFYRLKAWSPMVVRRGVYEDLLSDALDYRFHIHRALDELEHNAEDGVQVARSHLYNALTGL